jgi:tetratricopeptide (TPR) repeat protein
LAGIARRQGQWEQSSRLYAQAIELDPQNVFLLADASITDLCTRNAVAAQRHLTMARDLSPQNGTITGMLAGSYQLTGDVEKAQSILDSVQASEADQIYVTVLTYNAILLRKYEPAIAVLKSQLEKPQSLGPSLGIMENLLADLQRHAGDMAAATATYRQAREHLAEVLRAQPAYADILNSLAWSEAWLGDKPEALEHVRKAIATVPASRDAYVGPGYEDNLARIEAHFGDKDAAITALQHLLTIAYNYPPVTRALLRLDPDWDNLRGDPRFEKLCQEPAK